jgi:D-lyxose ketol-isomerase
MGVLRSDINDLVKTADLFFSANGWRLPPNPQWDVTDFGLGDWRRWGLVLVNLAEEPEYCEKIMYARRGMCTPWHTHRKKKEDIICRAGSLAVSLKAFDEHFSYKVNGEIRVSSSPERITPRSR